MSEVVQDIREMSLEEMDVVTGALGPVAVYLICAGAGAAVVAGGYLLAKFT